MLNSKDIVETYIRKGEYDDALSKINELLSQQDVNDINITEFKLLKIEILFLKGKYHLGLELIEEMKEKNKEKNDQLLSIDLLNLYIANLFELGKFDDMLKEIFAGEELLNKFDDLESPELLQRKSELLFNKGQVFLVKGDIQQANSLFQDVLANFRKMEDKIGVAKTLSQIASINRANNKMDLSINLYNEAIKLQDAVGDIYGKLSSLKDLGTVYLYAGDRKKAKEYYLKSFELTKKIDNKNYLGRIYNNLGIIEDLNGNLKEAIAYYEKSVYYMNEYQNIEMIAKTLNNIGSIYIKTGNLEQALETIEKSMEMFQKIGNVQNILNSFNHLGRIFVLKGNYEKAMTNFQMSFNMMDKVESKAFNSFTLYNYIKTAVLKNDLTLAKEKLAILEKLNVEISESSVYYRTILARALVLKASTRARDRVKAEEHLEEVIASEKAIAELKTDAMINLCEAKLVELKESNDSGLLKEVKKLANDILDLAIKQNSMFLHAETYWFLSQIALIELDYDAAKQLLIQAQLIAEEWDIRNLALKIALEHDKLIEKFDLWEKLTKNNATLKESIELVDIENFFSLTKDRRFEGKIIPEEPIMFMFLKKSGTPIYSRQYLKDDSLDDSLVSGFLAAINAFAKETFSSTGPIERIKHNDYTIIIQNLDPYIICYIFYGQSYSALQRMIQIIDGIKNDELVSEELRLLSDTTNRLTEETEKILNKIVDGILA